MARLASEAGDLPLEGGHCDDCRVVDVVDGSSPGLVVSVGVNALGCLMDGEARCYRWL